MIVKKTGVFAHFAVPEKRNEMAPEKEYSDIVAVCAESSFKMLARITDYNKGFLTHTSGDVKPHPSLPRHITKANAGYGSKLRKQNYKLLCVHHNPHPLPLT